ncbi:MAG: peptidylprolyl isomerase [Ilumatobacteraceae bacterium]
MIRRGTPGLLLVALSGALVLTGCGTFQDSDAAAIVDGTALSREDYESFLQVLVDNSDLTQVTEDTATGTVTGEAGRSALTRLVLTTATKEFLDDNGVTITDQERADALAELEVSNPDLEAPERVLDVVVDGSAAQTATARVAAPDAATIEQRYTERPASAGALCARHILVATEAEADAVAAELAAGADFAELAAERSTDQTADAGGVLLADTGGVLSGEGGAECFALTALTGAGPSFIEAVVGAEVGVPTAPVETSLGWHVLLARPYDEIRDSLAALYEAQAGQMLLGGYLAAVDIRIDPRYGRWDPFAMTVVAL